MKSVLNLVKSKNLVDFEALRTFFIRIAYFYSI